MNELATNTQNGLYRQREIWRSKPALRFHYVDFYNRLIRHIPEGDRVFELGCGSGNFKEYYPRIIATDLFEQPWVDRVLDATSIDTQFDRNSVDAFVMIDVIHHIVDPLGFIRNAAEALRSGGRIIMVEPYISRILGRVYSALHHENTDLSDDLTDNRSTVEENTEYANQAIPRLLFENSDKWLANKGDFGLIHAERFSGALYMLSGGFNYRNLLPYTLHRILMPLENAVIGALPSLLALRVLLVFEKKSTI